MSLAGDGGDKTTVYDNALAGCLADGHHGTGFSHLYIKVISLAMHNCVDHPLMITNVKCWGCHLVLQWLRELSKSMLQ